VAISIRFQSECPSLGKPKYVKIASPSLPRAKGTPSEQRQRKQLIAHPQLPRKVATLWRVRQSPEGLYLSSIPG
jgi:hypothetical protein